MVHCDFVCYSIICIGIIFILVVMLCVLHVRKLPVTMQETFGFPILQKHKISVILLNHKRTHNLKKSIPILSTYTCIHDICIYHGQEDHYFPFSSSSKNIMVRNIRDFVNDEMYGAARRFFHFPACKEDTILFLDDDLLPSQEWLWNAYEALQRYSPSSSSLGSVAGISVRCCSEEGYKSISPKDARCTDRIVLTNCCLMRKELTKEFMMVAFPSFETWFRQYKGNCEDIAFNLFLKNYVHNEPIFVKGKIKHLDGSKGYSSHQNHYFLRNQFCQKFSNISFFPQTNIPYHRITDIFSQFFFHYLDSHFVSSKKKLHASEKKIPQIDQIYCICLDERKSRMKQILSKQNLEEETLFLRAIRPFDVQQELYQQLSTTWTDPSSPIYMKLTKLPVHLSYLITMYHAMREGHETILIFEDDIVFSCTPRSLQNRIQEFLDISSRNAILYLGYCFLNCQDPQIHAVPKTDLVHIGNAHIACKHAMIHRTAYFPHFFASLSKLESSSDHQLEKYFIEQRIDRYVPLRPLFFQLRDKHLPSQNENYETLNACDFLFTAKRSIKIK